MHANRRSDLCQRCLQKDASALWLAATPATVAATQEVQLRLSVGGSASLYISSPLERCRRAIRTEGQHIGLAPSDDEMAGQAFLGFDMPTTLLAVDDQSEGSAPPLSDTKVFGIP